MTRDDTIYRYDISHLQLLLHRKCLRQVFRINNGLFNQIHSILPLEKKRRRQNAQWIYNHKMFTLVHDAVSTNMSPRVENQSIRVNITTILYRIKFTSLENIFIEDLFGSVRALEFRKLLTALRFVKNGLNNKLIRIIRKKSGCFRCWRKFAFNTRARFPGYLQYEIIVIWWIK